MKTKVHKRIEESDSLELRAWRSLADAYRLVYARVNSDLRLYGLTPPQYSVLRTVGRSASGSLAMNEIGKELLVTLADVTLIADNLERRGYLTRERETKDRRIVHIRLTSTGEALWKKILAVHRRKVAELMEGLSTRELKELIDDTAKIKERMMMLISKTDSENVKSAQKPLKRR